MIFLITFQILTDLELPFSDISDVSDDRDKDYVPDSYSSNSDSDETTSFVTVGLLTKPKHDDYTDRQQLSPPPPPITTTSTTINIEGCNLPDTPTRVTKQHYCLFCVKPQAKLKRHLLSQHKNERDMIPFLTASKTQEKKSCQNCVMLETMPTTSRL